MNPEREKTSMFQRILVAVGPSPARHSVVRMAGGLARLTGVSGHVLHVIASAATLDTVMRLEDDSAATAILDEAVATLRGMDVKTDGELARGMTNEVAGAISAVAEQLKADLLVVPPSPWIGRGLLQPPRERRRCSPPAESRYCSPPRSPASARADTEPSSPRRRTGGEPAHHGSRPGHR